ncbi:DUF6545 domain-containing protein, partial [Streptomyces sp. NPDC058847]|uniref:DUF6545 domain-containing protein n=1 Tax=Streptomyces sp. NPDC058847 TaxID=3346649 RepID=UPI0036C3A807
PAAVAGGGGGVFGGGGAAAARTVSAPPHTPPGGGPRRRPPDADWLSTDLAPPVACLSAIVIALGFILPHAGQYLHERRLVRLAHRELRPLYQLLRSGESAGLPFVLRSTPELRLVRRETFIRDALLPLSRHIDEARRRRSYEAALALGFAPERAKALAAAVVVLDAVEHGRRAPEREDGTGEVDSTDLLRDIGAMSRALRRPDEIEAVRARAAAPTESTRT